MHALTEETSIERSKGCTALLTFSFQTRLHSPFYTQHFNACNTGVSKLLVSVPEWKQHERGKDPAVTNHKLPRESSPSPCLWTPLLAIH